MPPFAKTLCWATVTACAMPGGLRCQDLRVVDSYTWLGAAYDAARGRIITLGAAGETCELDGATVRYLPVPRLGYLADALVRAPDGRSLMAVGDDNVQFVTTLFDGVAWHQHAGNVPSRRAEFAIVCDEARAEVLLFGGGLGLAALGDTWTFDGALWTQRQPPNAPSARMGAAAAYDSARARVVLFGGKDVSEFADTWEWNGATWSAASPPTTPPARGWAGLAFDAARSRIVMFGGIQSSLPHGDTWEYDGIDWHPLAPLPAPIPRAQPQLVFDAVHGETVMLGGADTDFLRDAWTWNGVRWQPIPVPASPNPRVGMTFADPAGTGLIVADYLQVPATWRWDASGWTRLAAVPPPQRLLHAALVEPTRVLVFGGVAPTSTLLNDLWSFDGTNWSLLANNGPAPRVGAAMAFDPSTGNVVLFGGHDLNYVTSGDTWTFDGVAWTQRQPATSPSTRSTAVATLDFVRQHVVLFGGFDSNGTRDDTWEWDGATWAPVASATTPLSDGEMSLAFDMTRGRTVLVRSSSGPPRVDAWTLEAAGWVPVAVSQPTTLFSLGGSKTAHGFPYLNGLLFEDSCHLYSLSAQQAEVGRFGTACTTTAAALIANSWPRLGAADFTVEVVGGPANSFVALVGAVQSAALPVGGCTLLVQPGQLALLLGTSGAGFVRAPLPVPAAYGLQGVELFFQVANFETSAPAGFTLSQGLRLRIGD